MSPNDPPPQTIPEESESKERIAHPFRTLRELVDYVSGKSLPTASPEEAGLTEAVPFPFLAIVGQPEMKLALLLGLVNPSVGGILLVGPRGTAKTTAVRSLLDILPKVERSLCYYGCLPEDIETGGIDAACPDCARKYAEGQPLVAPDRVRLVELPLNSRLEDVVGGIDERAAVTHERLRVRRGPVSATYRSRFVLVGSMNPEEGKLRPQILDRFGLRILVRGLDKPAERLEAYRRVQSYMANPLGMSVLYGQEMAAAAEEIQSARAQLPKVTIPDKVAKPAIKLVQKMGIDSLRAEITWFEAARAFAAADGRLEVRPEDLREIAPMALRLRRSEFMTEYFSNQEGEEEEMRKLLGSLSKKQVPNTHGS
jgi:magnesium chelatase subunit I